MPTVQTAMQALIAAHKHVQNGKRADEDSESTDAGSSESEADTGFLSSASCSDAGSDLDSTDKSQLSRQLHSRPPPAPARRFRLQGRAAIFRGTPLLTIPGTPASKTSTWRAEDPSSSEDEEEADREPSEGTEESLRVATHSALSPAPDRPALVISAAQKLSAPPGLSPSSMPMFRPPPGLPPPPPPGLQLTRLPDSGPSSAPPRHSTPAASPADNPILSTVPPQRVAPFTAPQQKLTPRMVLPSRQAPMMSQAEFQSALPDWDASSPADSKSMDVKGFLPPMRAEKMQVMLSTHGIRSSSALAAR